MINAEDIVTIVNANAGVIQEELLDCLSHFPWKEVPEGWYQFALMRALRKEGYKSYAEYGLGSVGGPENDKADIAVFERESEFKRPSALIEIKATGSGPGGFQKDRNRLTKIARERGIDGILVYFTPALTDGERAGEEQEFRRWCENADAITTRWFGFSDVVSAMPEAGQKLRDRKWGVLTATFSARSCDRQGARR
jgi:hypothetical protein